MIPNIRSNLYRWGMPALGCLGLSLCACSDEKAPASATQAPAPASAAPTQDQSVSAKCGLPESPRESPQFDYDEAALRPRGQEILDRLATCLREGSLKGETVTIIGHTDPRGTERYNAALGLQRANAARDYLANHGVAPSVISVESRGERGATGADSSGWQLDRRVEIRENLQSRR